MKLMKTTLMACCMLAVSLPAFAQEVPAPGKSPRIDAIKKAGALRVGVLANAPWLVENTTSSGDQWSGPAWTLAQEYAKLLGVKLQPVLVSHETKVPVLAANQVDISITPLAENAERKAGNISEWVRRFGGAYEFMVVLDADSTMAGETLLRLADAMERNPNEGLLLEWLLLQLPPPGHS